MLVKRHKSAFNIMLERHNRWSAYVIMKVSAVAASRNRSTSDFYSMWMDLLCAAAALFIPIPRLCICAGGHDCSTCATNMVCAGRSLFHLRADSVNVFPALCLVTGFYICMNVVVIIVWQCNEHRQHDGFFGCVFCSCMVFPKCSCVVNYKHLRLVLS